ncbi:hypothetical protein G210_3164 [Candida maltosa Xu316]|uniref:Uncharacterized protein n=1 Tax=Candida maltosa (strain Xu316) TaxID=1245528 RepID=M3JUN7_CANMX|nr:hypothetical protein G210_3164 [Candida maltosa Xu316]
MSNEFTCNSCYYTGNLNCKVVYKIEDGEIRLTKHCKFCKEGECKLSFSSEDELDKRKLDYFLNLKKIDFVWTKFTNQQQGYKNALKEGERKFNEKFGHLEAMEHDDQVAVSEDKEGFQIKENTMSLNDENRMLKEELKAALEKIKNMDSENDYKRKKA